MKGIIALTIAISVLGGIYVSSHKARDFGGARISFSKHPAKVSQGDRVLVWKGDTQTNGSDTKVLSASDGTGSSESGKTPVSGNDGRTSEPTGQDKALDGSREAGETSNQPQATVVQIVDYIHLAESSRGLNKNPYALHNVCKAKGKSNEYGYGGMQSMLCYDNHEQATRIVSDRIVRLLDTYEGNIAKALCTYNLGYDKDSDGKQIPYINCKYYQRFIGAI